MNLNFIILFLCFFEFHQAELSCLPSYYSCGISQLFPCIPNDWVCDHNRDCDDGSDETGCPKLSCSPDQFHCINSDQCIKKSQVCDGRKDCVDNSDEEVCTSVKKSCDLTTEYDCLNDATIECISLANVCDRMKNCSNGRNLKEDCSKDMCLDSNKRSLCSHKCANKYSSFACYCPKGMVLGKDMLTCSKINPCFQIPDKCQQDCTVTMEGYLCSCYEGFIKDGEECLVDNTDAVPHMFYSTFNGIYDVTLLQNTSTTFDKTRKLVPLSDKLLSFDVKISGDDLEIYSTHVDNWTVLSLHTITGWNKQLKVPNLKKNKDSKNITFPTSFYSIAKDPVRNLVFWTDTNASKISVFNASNNDLTDIIVKDCYYPFGIVVNPISAKIFWIDLGNGLVLPRILMSSMDGSNPTVLISSGLRRPTSLVLDFENQLLYWNDLSPGSIKFLDLNSFAIGKSEINVVFETHNFFPVSLAIYKNRIYWSDLHQNRIYSAHRVSGNSMRTVVEQVQASIIKIVSSLSNSDISQKTNDVKVSSVCSGVRNLCQYSCLPSSDKDKVKCFGTFHLPPKSANNHSTAWWFVLIPIAVLSVICLAMFKVLYFNRRNVGHLPVLIGNNDHVQFFDERDAVSTNDTVEIDIEDSMPILQTV